MDKIYLDDLQVLKDKASKISNTPMMAFGKVLMLVMLNMRYEKIMIDRNLKEHPYILTGQFIKDAAKFIDMWAEVNFIENAKSGALLKEKISMEGEHENLFQKLWVRFSEEDYRDRIKRYEYRLDINSLGNGWLKGFKCVDFGCGHGNFAHALIRKGAAYLYGIDFGKNSIEYAIKARDRLGVKPNQLEFKVESVYHVSKQDNTFDFAIQNGVFHHVDDENAAIKEVRRVLKPGGWFWYYTDGSGAISHDLWDASVYMLKDLPKDFILDALDKLNLEVGKKYHLSDGLNAIYRHTTWDELTSRLKTLGFGNFRRLVGGFKTDFDHDVISEDKYGKEKFGEGDLRLLAQKL